MHIGFLSKAHSNDAVPDETIAASLQLITSRVFSLINV